MTIDQNILTQIQEENLDLTSIQLHQERVLKSLKGVLKSDFKILDTCRLNNGGIQSLPLSLKSSPVSREFYGKTIGFIPAAGASSRYITPLFPLFDAARAQDFTRCAQAIQELKHLGILDCPLPKSVRKLIQHVEQKVSTELLNEVMNEIDAPKALYPATVENFSFLDLKRMEHGRMSFLGGELYICPPHRQKSFKDALESISSSVAAQVLEQGPELATLRLEEDGHVALDHHGKISMVPSGHGSLMTLLPKVKDLFPNGNSVLIRNIDNVSGTSEEVLESTNHLVESFHKTLQLLMELRKAVLEHSTQSQSLATKLLDLWGIRRDQELSPLEALLKNLFHLEEINLNLNSTTHLQKALDRPLVLMGQVPNTGNDVGGTAVYAEVNHKKQKLCIELPHVSDSDRKAFLSSSQTATHFNPVFVIMEIPRKSQLENWSDHPFWLIAKKQWNGRNVYYQESILYEMIGSSLYTNLIFVETPRILFNPHKTLQDTKNRSLSHWISTSK